MNEDDDEFLQVAFKAGVFCVLALALALFFGGFSAVYVILGGIVFSVLVLIAYADYIPNR